MDDLDDLKNGNPDNEQKEPTITLTPEDGNELLEGFAGIKRCLNELEERRKEQREKLIIRMDKHIEEREALIAKKKQAKQKRLGLEAENNNNNNDDNNSNQPSSFSL